SRRRRRSQGGRRTRVLGSEVAESRGISVSGGRVARSERATRPPERITAPVLGHANRESGTRHGRGPAPASRPARPAPFPPTPPRSRGERYPRSYRRRKAPKPKSSNARPRAMQNNPQVIEF